jgi:hypothetical protein
MRMTGVWIRKPSDELTSVMHLYKQSLVKITLRQLRYLCAYCSKTRCFLSNSG